MNQYQVDANVDQRAEVREERDDWLALQGEADPLDKAAGCLPLHLSPEKRTIHQPTAVQKKFIYFRVYYTIKCIKPY